MYETHDFMVFLNFYNCKTDKSSIMFHTSVCVMYDCEIYVHQVKKCYFKCLGFGLDFRGTLFKILQRNFLVMG